MKKPGQKTGRLGDPFGPLARLQSRSTSSSQQSAGARSRAYAG